MSERLAVDIARDLRIPGPWPSLRLLTEAADKLEGLVELLAGAERDRDEARAANGRLRVELGQARSLVDYAMTLRIHGEHAPGGNETWREFEHRCQQWAAGEPA